MQSDLGKLFIGGISWDTNEERLKEYFSSYGEVLEAVIMKDHITCRARGFGFVVFSDPIVAERVTKEKHNIDGRMVEAKKAVPRDDQITISRNSSNVQGSPSSGRTRKIFVGGLASTITKNDFRRYFEQYGTITDVVVMYDHNTQRPRGFGFITYDLEYAIDNVLLKTFHELNGKMVEVKRAVPKELSPGPSRSTFGAYPYGLSRTSSFLNGYNQRVYSSNAIGIGGYGVRMDGSFCPIPSTRSGFATFGSGYGMGLNFELGMSRNYGGGTNFNSTLSYGRGMSPYYAGNSNRFRSPISFDGGNGGNTSFFSSNPRNLWGNGGLNYESHSTGSSAYVGSGSGVIGGGILGNTGLNWGSSLISPQGGVNASTQSANICYGGGDNSYGLRGTTYGRNATTNAIPTSSYVASSVGYDGPFSNFYGSGGLVCGGDPTWRTINSEREEPGSFGGYGLGDGGFDVQTKSSSGYIGGYIVAKRHENRGIAG